MTPGEGGIAIRRSMTGTIDQELLHSYKAIAFDAVAGVSREAIVGDAEAFLARHYLRWMASVFGGSADNKVADDPGLDKVAARLDEVYRWQEDDFLPVRLIRSR